MAENKKSFLLYCDIIHTVKKLPIDKAGELFITILEYVNDQNPVINDTIIDLVFEPIKQNLKRSLKDWESKKVEKSDSGKLGNLKRWNPELYNQVILGNLLIEDALIIASNRKISHSDNTDRTAMQSIANVAVNVNDNVSVINTEEGLKPRDQKKVNSTKVKMQPPNLKTVRDFFLKIAGDSKKLHSWPPDKCQNTADLMHDHYEMNGWVQNKGKPIVSWQAACRQWIRREVDGTFSKPEFIKPETPVKHHLNSTTINLHPMENEINYLFERFLENDQWALTNEIDAKYYDFLKKDKRINFSNEQTADIKTKAIRKLNMDPERIPTEVLVRAMKHIGVLEYFKQQELQGKTKIF